jgi:hypothetical protein
MRVGRSERGSSKHRTRVKDLTLSQFSGILALELGSREDRLEEGYDEARCYQQTTRT